MIGDVNKHTTASAQRRLSIERVGVKDGAFLCEQTECEADCMLFVVWRMWRNDQKRSVSHYSSVARVPRFWRLGRYNCIKLLTPRGSLPLAAKSSGGVGQIQEKESALCIHAGCGTHATAEILDLALCS